MSGGYWEYRDEYLMNDIFGYDSEEGIVPDVFEDVVMSNLIYDVFEILHQFDWYRSSDTSEETYRKAVAEFKKKWFKNTKSTFNKLIKDEIKALEDRLKQTFETDLDEGDKED